MAEQPQQRHVGVGGVSFNWRLIVRVVAIVLFIIATLMAKGKATLADWPPEALAYLGLGLWLSTETF